SFEVPLRSGPRHCGQSAATEKTPRTAATRSNHRVFILHLTEESLSDQRPGPRTGGRKGDYTAWAADKRLAIVEIAAPVRLPLAAEVGSRHSWHRRRRPQPNDPAPKAPRSPRMRTALYVLAGLFLTARPLPAAKPAAWTIDDIILAESIHDIQVSPD